MRKALQILGVLNDEDVNWLVQNGLRETHAPGAVLIREGEPIASLIILLSGQLSVTRDNRKLAVLYSGEIIGEIAMVDKQPPTATVTALQESQVLNIERVVLEHRMLSDIGFSSRFYQAVAMFLADRLRSTVGILGYGEGRPSADPDELDDDAVGNVSEAAARFDRMLRCLHAAA